MRQLQEDARTVACVLVTATGSPVIKIKEYNQTLCYDIMRRRSVDPTDKPYTTGVVLIGGIIQAVLFSSMHFGSWVPAGRMNGQSQCC